MNGNRALLVALGALALAYSAFLLRQDGRSGVPWLPPCLFHLATGLDCAGCGMTRATYAALHGRIGEAFRLNPVGMVLLPLALLGVGLEIMGWVRGKPLPWRLTVGPKGAWVIAGVVLAFTVLRNVPVWPLTLLAPP